MRAIQERGQEEMQQAPQLAASPMITHVTLNDAGAYYIVTEPESRALLRARTKKSQRRREQPAAIPFFPRRLGGSKQHHVCVKSDDVEVEQSSASCRS